MEEVKDVEVYWFNKKDRYIVVDIKVDGFRVVTDKVIFSSSSNSLVLSYRRSDLETGKAVNEDVLQNKKIILCQESGEMVNVRTTKVRHWKSETYVTIWLC